MSQETPHGKFHCDCGCMGAGPLFSEFFRKMGPSEEVSRHFRNARVEFLKGLRTLLDERIASMSEQPRQGTKITVE